MFPLSTVLFPGAPLPLHVFEPRYQVMLRRCLEGDRQFGVVLIARGSEVGGGESRLDVGTVARIQEARSLPDGRSVLLAQGTRRFRVVEWLPDDPHPQAMVEWLPETVPGAAAREAAVSALRRLRALLSELREVAAAEEQPDEAGWWLCAQLPVNPLDRQRLLECDEADVRLGVACELATEAAEDLARLLAGG